MKVIQTFQDINSETKKVVSVRKFQILKPTVAAVSAKKQPNMPQAVLRYTEKVEEEQ